MTVKPQVSHHVQDPRGGGRFKEAATGLLNLEGFSLTFSVVAEVLHYLLATSDLARTTGDRSTCRLSQ